MIYITDLANALMWNKISNRLAHSKQTFFEWIKKKIITL